MYGISEKGSHEAPKEEATTPMLQKFFMCKANCPKTLPSCESPSGIPKAGIHETSRNKAIMDTAIFVISFSLLVSVISTITSR